MPPNATRSSTLGWQGRSSRACAKEPAAISASAAMPVRQCQLADPEQRRLMTAGDRHVAFRVLRRDGRARGRRRHLPALPIRANAWQGAADGGCSSGASPRVIEQDSRRPRPVFGKAPDRADQRIVVGRLDGQSKFARDLARSSTGKAHPQIPRGHRAIGERVDHRGGAARAVQSPRREDRSSASTGRASRARRLRSPRATQAALPRLPPSHSPREGGMPISAIEASAVRPSSSPRVTAMA